MADTLPGIGEEGQAMAAQGAGVRITLSGVDEAAVEMAADELKQRLGARFAVTRRQWRRDRAGFSLTATMLTGSAAHVDAAAAGLLDLLYAGRADNAGHAVGE